MGAAKKIKVAIEQGDYVSKYVLEAFNGKPRPATTKSLFGDDLPRAIRTRELAIGFGMVEDTTRPDCDLCGGTAPRCVALCNRALRMAPPAEPAKPAKVAGRQPRSLFGDQDF